jgi:hypothetical protein
MIQLAYLDFFLGGGDDAILEYLISILLIIRLITSI